MEKKEYSEMTQEEIVNELKEYINGIETVDIAQPQTQDELIEALKLNQEMTNMLNKIRAYCQVLAIKQLKEYNLMIHDFKGEESNLVKESNYKDDEEFTGFCD